MSPHIESTGYVSGPVDLDGMSLGQYTLCIEDLLMRLKKPKKTMLVAALLLVAVVAVLYYRFRYPAYELIDLGSLGGKYGEATAVNSLGQVAGWSKIDEDDDHAFLWDVENGIRDLGTIGGARSYAYDINDKGWIVGQLRNSKTKLYRPILLRPK